jgi:hypothetical protein|tara:strand:- start:663 stop:863 length:201 start_codon:yes stop_codon:yes gene_type:complete
MYCDKCDRDVGTEKDSKMITILVLLVFGLLCPLWLITLPIFWGIAIYLALKNKSIKCGICKNILTN